MVLTNGDDLHLLDSFKLWAEQIFGWYYFVERSVYVPSKDGHGGHYARKRIKKRLINKQYLIVARGAAKSMYASCIQNYFLNVDTSTTHQVTTAPTMPQAEEVMSPIKTAITRARGPLYQFLTYGSLQNTTGSRADRVKLASTKKGIQNFLTGSLLEVRPMSIDKLQGLRVKIATVDEWLSGDVREDVIGALEQGAAKEQGGGMNDDYLIVAISSEGTVRNGSGDTIKMELMSILKGEYNAPHTSIWWYALDSVDEVSEPDLWIKANPNLGKTVSYETYQLDVERAEKNPAVRNDILAKRFGIPMEGYTYYFTYEETLPHRKKEYWQMPWAGFTKSISTVTGCLVCVSDQEQIVAANGPEQKNYLGKSISSRLEEAILNRKTVLARPGEKAYFSILENTDNTTPLPELIFPILSSGDAIGSVILCGKDRESLPGDTEKKLLQVAATYLGREMEN